MERLPVSSEVFEEQLHPPCRTLRKARSACVPGVMGLISVNLNGSTPREDHRTQEANQTWGTLEVPKGPRHMRAHPKVMHTATLAGQRTLPRTANRRSRELQGCKVSPTRGSPVTVLPRSRLFSCR